MHAYLHNTSPANLKKNKNNSLLSCVSFQISVSTMSAALGSMESLARVFGLLGISQRDKQGLGEQCGINSVETLIANRNNLARSPYKACHLLVAGIDFISERRSNMSPPHDDSKVHELFTSSASLDQSFEHHLAQRVERARTGKHEEFASKARRERQAGKQSDAKASKDKVFRNGDVYWEHTEDINMDSAAEGVDVDDLGIQGKDSKWTLDETKEHVCLKTSPKDIRIPKRLFKDLYCFQRTGIAWLSGLYINETGGILGDQMGMGKTMQTATFLFALMSSGAIRNALVVCPKTVLETTWVKEAKYLMQFFTWDKEKPKIVLVGNHLSETQRYQVLKVARNCTSERPHIVIASYPQVQKKKGYTSGQKGTGCFDYVVLDEAHRVKNTKTLARQNLQKISKYSRKLLLTGTPFLNEPRELYSLLELAVGTDIMGSWPQFRDRLVKPIEAARQPDSSNYQRKQASELITKLQDLIRPYLLQRKKQDFMKDSIPPSHQFDVWMRLSPQQRKLYKEFVAGKLQSGMVDEGWKCCLPAIHRLRELTNHPLLFLKHSSEAAMETVKAEMAKMKRAEIVKQSPKLELLVELLHKWRSEGLKALVFSHSVQMLDVIQYVLATMEGIDACRIDGQTSQERRKILVNDFNRVGSQYNVMLLSIETGGEGLTLIGANKSVLFDPAWNQAKTDQAVARTCRPGQTRECECIHFLTAGAVEEKMYGKQIYKGSMDRTLLGKSNGNGAFHQKRIYTKDELTQLFELDADGRCESLERSNQSDDGAWRNKCSIRRDTPAVVGISRRSVIYKS